jgi:nanoRNase/pAp phosphatase (c-di-AMP/oligoRNAs hydrolase)
MRSQGRTGDLLGVLSRHRGERHVVALQDYPDPDAIASAMAHQRLGRAIGIQTDLVYAGEMSRPQNRRLVEELGVVLRHPREGFGVAHADGAVFVDNQGATCSYLVRLLAHSEVPPILVVDHHEGEAAVRPEVQIVEDVGATATIYAEILRDRPWPLEPELDPGALLASGLLYGILTDTQGLKHANRRDLEAASWLAPLSDLELLEGIASQAIPRETVELLCRALAANVLAHGFCFAGVGYLRAEHRDAIPQAAEWLLSLPEVHTSLVFGIVRDWRLRETITGSLRTDLPGLSPRAFLRRVVGPGVAEGAAIGGRAHAGGFEIPVGLSSRAASMDLQLARWGYFEHLMLEAFLRAAETTPVELASPPGSSPSTAGLGPALQEGSPAWRVLNPIWDDRGGIDPEHDPVFPRPWDRGGEWRIARPRRPANPADWTIGEL